MLLRLFIISLLTLFIISFVFLSHLHAEDFQAFESYAWNSITDARNRMREAQAEGHIEIDVTNGISIIGDLPTHENQKEALFVETKSLGESTKSKPKRIAFAITITKDGNFQDGAAVLAYSIFKHNLHNQVHQDKILSKGFDVSLIAFVHPLVKQREVLKKLGYHVIEVPLPINITAIQGKNLREHINLNGCCGASELIKLSSYRLMQYDWVVHMDADTFVNGAIDELFYPEDNDLSLAYTTDPNMATHKGEDKMPAQGGFLLIKPSEADFRGIIRTILTTEFKNGGGWNGSKIGWFWGGMTVQGVLPYYYNRVSVNPQTPNKTRRKIIDRCIYNTMADSDECLKKPISQVKSAHFTICQKPWTCFKWGSSKKICEMPTCNPLCKAVHEEWFRLRKEAEEFYGMPVIDDACAGPRGHPYIVMNMENAHLGAGGNLSTAPVPDDSPDLLKPPKPESGYREDTEDWDNFVGGHVPKPKKPKGKRRL